MEEINWFDERYDDLAFALNLNANRGKCENCAIRWIFVNARMRDLCARCYNSELMKEED